MNNELTHEETTTMQTLDLIHTEHKDWMKIMRLMRALRNGSIAISDPDTLDDVLKETAKHMVDLHNRVHGTCRNEKVVIERLGI